MLQPCIVSISVLNNYNLKIEYETGEIKKFDVTPYITGTWYGELKDVDYFKTVRVLPGGVGIEWEHGQDVSPHELYENSISM